MLIDEALKVYISAYKKGIRNYSSMISKGQNGYLPFLEGIIKNKDIVSEVNIGNIEVPLNKIKGTYTHGRSLSFASNFMPIMKEQTEFASKWLNVVMAHSNEGLRDSIKVYEYLNWFFVVEGNKRVSVLKYFDVYSFRADVIRLIPKYDEDDKTIRIYYEFLDFFNKTKINSIWFTNENSFNTILQYMEFYEPENNIHANQHIAFEKDIYVPFKKHYHDNGGQIIDVTTGDALLEYIKLYGVPKNDEFLESERLDKRISNLVKELSILHNDSELEINTKVGGGKSLVSSITSFIKLRRTLEVAFAYPKTIETSNWSYNHELGRRYVSEKLNSDINTSFIDNVPENKNSYKQLKDLAKEGYDVIFATSPAFITGTLKAAMEYPDTLFLNCSQSYSFKHVATYFGRIHEARFLAGIIAGSQTCSDILGYVATFAVPEVISGINAFALGAKLVNPRARIKVEWINEWDAHTKSQQASSLLISKGADILAHHNNIGRITTSKEYGLYTMVCPGDESSTCKTHEYLASPLWNWGNFYERILNIVSSSSYKTASSLSNTKKHVNFWWGMDAGVVDLVYSKRLVPQRTQILVEYIRQGLISGIFEPFEGPIKDNTGKIRIEADTTATNQEILSMNWFVENVETNIPSSGYKHPDTNLITGNLEI